MNLDRRDLLKVMGTAAGGMLLSQVLAGCSSGGSAPSSGTPNPTGGDVAKELAGSATIFIWPGLVPKIVNEHAKKPMSGKYPKAEIKYEEGTNAATYPKILAQKDNPYISGGMMNDLFAAKGIQDGLYDKFNPEWLPNMKNVLSDINTPGGFGMIFQLTPFGIAYNPDLMDEPKSWTDLWDSKYKGKISMWDGYYDGYMMAAKSVGKGMDAEAGIKEWEKYKANIGRFINSPTGTEEAIDKGEVWAAPHWGAWGEQARTQGKKIAFTIPKEGAVLWGGHLQVFKGFNATTQEITQRFLNYWLEPAAQQAFMEEGFFISPVKGMKIPDKVKNSKAIMPIEEAVKVLHTYDVEKLASESGKYKQLIDRTLK